MKVIRWLLIIERQQRSLTAQWLLNGCSTPKIFVVGCHLMCVMCLWRTDTETRKGTCFDLAQTPKRHNTARTLHTRAAIGHEFGGKVYFLSLAHCSLPKTPRNFINSQCIIRHLERASYAPIRSKWSEPASKGIATALRSLEIAEVFR